MTEPIEQQTLVPAKPLTVSYAIVTFFSYFSLLGGVVGLFYFAVHKRMAVDKIGAGSFNKALLDQIQVMKTDFMFTGIYLFLSGVLLFAVLNLLRAIFKKVVWNE